MPENLNPEQQLEYLKELRRKYEEALSNSEKTGDYSEATKLKEELEARLSALEALFPKNESKEKLKETSVERAQEIMGSRMYGLDAVEIAFGSRVSEGAKREYYDINGQPYLVPYSEEDLKEAKKNGEMLIYRAGYIASGIISDFENDNILTMEIINQIIITREIYPHGGLLKIDNNVIDTWNDNPAWYSYNSLSAGWALVGSKPLPNSTSKDYFEQTKVLRDYLNNLGVLTSDELSNCSDEVLDAIREDFNSDPHDAVIDLVNLEINQDFRRSPGDALYDLAIQYANSGYKNKLSNEVFELTNQGELITPGIIAFGSGGLITKLGTLGYSDNAGVILTH